MARARARARMWGYIASGMTCLTALAAFAAMIWFGWQRGSRDGLVLIGVPAALMAYAGLHQLGTYANLSRAANLADLFGDTTWLSWCAGALFSLGPLQPIISSGAAHAIPTGVLPLSLG